MSDDENSISAKHAQDDAGEDCAPSETACKGCGNDIDPDTCGCGESKRSHSAWRAGHSFIPLGCGCFRYTSPPSTKDPRR